MRKVKRFDKAREEDKSVRVIVTGFVLMMAMIGLGAGLMALPTPFFMAMAIMPEGETLKDKWKKMSKKQKGLFALIMVILLPFLMVGILWTALIGSLILIDLMFFIPIFLIGAWFIFRKPEYQKGAFTQFLGSKYSLMMGVILLAFIIGVAVWNYWEYYTESQYGNLDMSEQMTSVVDGIPIGNDTYKGYLNTPIRGSNGEIIDNVTFNPKRTWNVTIRVSDVLSPAWFGYNTGTPDVIDYLRTQVKTDVNNETNVSENIDVKNKSLMLKKVYENFIVKQYGMPIVNALVVLEGKAIEGNAKGIPEGEPAQFEQYTDSNGVVIFKNVREGIYILRVYAYGYRPYIREFPVVNYTVQGRIYRIPLVPDYYKVRVHWEVNINTKMDWMVITTFKQELSNSTGVEFVNATPMNDFEIINYTLKLENDTFWSNMQRINSMYGWLGLNNPSSPFRYIGEQMLYAQNSIYYQSMYINPANNQNIYGHFLWFVVVAVAVAVAVAEYYFSSVTVVKAKTIELEISVDKPAMGQAVSGHAPDVYVFTRGGNAIASTGTTASMIYQVDKLRNEQDNMHYIEVEENKIIGEEVLIVFAKDVPSPATIKLHAHLIVHCDIAEKKGGEITIQNRETKFHFSDEITFTTTDFSFAEWVS